MSLIRLYGRDGCHLCDEARAGLLRLRERGVDFKLEEIDIETDDQLHARMLERIPVIEVDGVEVSDLFFDADAVIARIDTFPR